MFAEEQPDEFQDGRFAGSRTAREDDPAWHVTFTAVAGFHSVKSEDNWLLQKPTLSGHEDRSIVDRLPGLDVHVELHALVPCRLQLDVVAPWRKRQQL